jgi:predicted ribosome quality control (RQC) complex YloA/Tae2 family protein
MADPINPHERRAQALAEISQMQEDNVALQARNAELQGQMRDRETALQREINRQEARADTAERNAALYRAEAHLFRAKLVEMVTTISLIRQATDGAEKIAATVKSLHSSQSPETEEQEQQEARDLVDSLGHLSGTHVDGEIQDIEGDIEQLLRSSATAREGS